MQVSSSPFSLHICVAVIYWSTASFPSSGYCDRPWRLEELLTHKAEVLTADELLNDEAEELTAEEIHADEAEELTAEELHTGEAEELTAEELLISH